MAFCKSTPGAAIESFPGQSIESWQSRLRLLEVWAIIFQVALCKLRSVASLESFVPHVSVILSVLRFRAGRFGAVSVPGVAMGGTLKNVKTAFSMVSELIPLALSALVA